MTERYRVAVPSDEPKGLESARSAHFGHCACFTMVDLEGGAVAGVSTVQNVDHEHGGCLGPVQLLAAQGANGIIAAGMGGRPLAGFAQYGIDVIYDAESPRVVDAIERFLAGDVVVMGPENSCGCH